jgi:hypothetical protein
MSDHHSVAEKVRDLRTDVPELGYYRQQLLNFVDAPESGLDRALRDARSIVERVVNALLEKEKVEVRRDLLDNIETLGSREEKPAKRRAGQPACLPENIYAFLHNLRILGNLGTHPFEPGTTQLKNVSLRASDRDATLNQLLRLVEWFFEEYGQGPKLKTIYASGTVRQNDKREIRIVQHSPILYWWPVWAFGFLMALITFMKDARMVIVPHGSKMDLAQTTSDKLVIDLPKDWPTPSIDEARANQGAFRIHTADTPYLGTFFVGLLLGIIIITNVPLRGLWSVLVIMLMVISIIFVTLLGGWGGIFWFFGDFLHIHINAGGYVFISTVLFAVWVLVIFIFDPQVYMIFTPRELKVRQQVGGTELTHDITGMRIPTEGDLTYDPTMPVVAKFRDDLFRHWLLGLGTGDLLVRTSGINPQEYHFHNVAWVGSKLAKIEEMLREQTGEQKTP